MIYIAPSHQGFFFEVGVGVGPEGGFSCAFGIWHTFTDDPSIGTSGFKVGGKCSHVKHFEMVLHYLPHDII